MSYCELWFAALHAPWTRLPTPDPCADVLEGAGTFPCSQPQAPPPGGGFALKLICTLLAHWAARLPVACFSLLSEVCSGLWLSKAELLQGHTSVARLPGLWGPPSLPAHHGLAAHLSDLGFLICKPGSLTALPTRLSPGDSGWQAARTNTPRLFLVVTRLPDELPRSHFTDLEAEAAAILPNSRH